MTEMPDRELERLRRGQSFGPVVAHASGTREERPGHHHMNLLDDQRLVMEVESLRV